MKHIAPTLKEKIISLPKLWSFSCTNVDKKCIWKLFKNTTKQTIGHGKDGKLKGLQPRHAKLSVGAASTLAIYLLETHRMKN